MARWLFQKYYQHYLHGFHACIHVGRSSGWYYDHLGQMKPVRFSDPTLLFALSSGGRKTTVSTVMRVPCPQSADACASAHKTPRLLNFAPRSSLEPARNFASSPTSPDLSETYRDASCTLPGGTDSDTALFFTLGRISTVPTAADIMAAAPSPFALNLNMTPEQYPGS